MTSQVPSDLHMHMCKDWGKGGKRKDGRKKKRKKEKKERKQERRQTEGEGMRKEERKKRGRRGREEKGELRGHLCSQLVIQLWPQEPQALALGKMSSLNQLGFSEAEVWLYRACPSLWRPANPSCL